MAKQRPSKPAPPVSPAARPLVDRLLDRVKNNRVAAAIILLAMGIGGLASLTDATRKLGGLWAGLADTRVEGQWKSAAALFHYTGPETMRLHLKEPVAGQVVGSVQLSGNDVMQPRSFALLEGRHDGKAMTLVLNTGDRQPATLHATVGGSELHLVYQRPGQSAVSATARRLEQSRQLVAGRLAIVYQRREFADHVAACTQLLKDLDPPQGYKHSEPPDEHGNIRCVGLPPAGHHGYDQYAGRARRQVVCPPHSLTTLVDGAEPALAQACECNGDKPADAGVCPAASPGG